MRVFPDPRNPISTDFYSSKLLLKAYLYQALQWYCGLLLVRTAQSGKYEGPDSHHFGPALQPGELSKDHRRFGQMPSGRGSFH